MFAVIEFADVKEGGRSYEFAIVPLLWLQKHESKCFWPSSTKGVDIDKFIQDLTPYKTSWPMYPVYKVYFKTTLYKTAEDKLKMLIETVSELSESSGSVNPSIKSVVGITINTPQVENKILAIGEKIRSSVESEEDEELNTDEDTNIDSSEDEDNISQIPRKKFKSSSHFTANLKAKIPTSNPRRNTDKSKPDSRTFSPSPLIQTSSQRLHTHTPSPRLHTETSSPKLHSQTFTRKPRTSTTDYPNCASTSRETPSPRREVQTPLQNEEPPMQSNSFSDQQSTSAIMNLLNKIDIKVENNSIMLNELVKLNRTINQDKLIPPANLPTFPIKDNETFLMFEQTLGEQTIREHMVKRLAAVGGSTLASTTRRIIRYLLIDGVLVLYNWKGRGKLSFEKTNTMAVITEAARYNYPSSEKNDFLVGNTIKDFLKFAKARLDKKRI